MENVRSSSLTSLYLDSGSALSTSQPPSLPSKLPVEPSTSQTLFVNTGSPVFGKTSVVRSRIGREMSEREIIQLEEKRDRERVKAMNKARYQMGRWRKKEDRALIDLIKRHGENFKKISSLMYSRSQTQVRQRYETHFKENCDKSPWSPEEIAALKQIWFDVTKWPKRIQCIREIHKKKRTRTNIQRMWNALVEAEGLRYAMGASKEEVLRRNERRDARKNKRVRLSPSEIKP